MPTWPGSLPAPSPNGYQEKMPDNTIRTEMDVGPPKIRKRSTATPRLFRLSFDMDNTDVNTLDTFFTTTVNDGVDSFDMDDPRNGTTGTFRIIGPPDISALTGTYYRVTINMEKLPS